MTARVRSVDIKLHDRVIDGIDVGDGLLPVAEAIASDVKAATSSSARIHQFGKQMVAERTETGARAGTDWPIAHIIEYGTINTPAHRIATNIAGRHGRTGPAR